MFLVGLGAESVFMKLAERCVCGNITNQTENYQLMYPDIGLFNSGIGIDKFGIGIEVCYKKN